MFLFEFILLCKEFIINTGNLFVKIMFIMAMGNTAFLKMSANFCVGLALYF